MATAGSVVGEKLVMRILDPARQMASLTRIGMRGSMHKKIRPIVTQPHGLFIVCGPTGAGKSTTLYACLDEIDRYQKNVITIENPVEYHIDNVTQIEVNPKAGKTFASELRSILRQDPDVIYIGEIRDQETAEIACQAAQTGHMVFTTLHANDTVTAAGASDRPGRAAVHGRQRRRRRAGPAAGARALSEMQARVQAQRRPAAQGQSAGGQDQVLLSAAGGDAGAKNEEGGLKSVSALRRHRLSRPNRRLRVAGHHATTSRDMIRENPNFNAIKQEAVKDGHEVAAGGRTSPGDRRSDVDPGVVRVCE